MYKSVEFALPNKVIDVTLIQSHQLHMCQICQKIYFAIDPKIGADRSLSTQWLQGESTQVEF